MVRHRSVSAKKNPRSFGKKKASHSAFKRKAPKKRPAFGKRKAAPKPLQYVIRGTKGASFFYYVGDRFSSTKTDAARYSNMDVAMKVARHIRPMLPRELAYLKVIPA